MINKIFCIRCGKDDVVRNGRVDKHQKFKCKACNFQFIEGKLHHKRLDIKLLAIFLYIQGVSIKKIAEFFAVSPTAVAKWLRSFEHKYNLNLKLFSNPDISNKKSGDALKSLVIKVAPNELEILKR